MPTNAAVASSAPAEMAVESGLYSQESERLIISIMMNSGRKDSHHQLASLLAPEDFYLDQHQTIWRIIQQLREAGLEADPAAVIDNASRQNEFVGGAQYVVDAVNDPIARMCSNESVVAASARIKELAMGRKLQRSLSQAVALCGSQTFERVLSFVEDDLVNLRRSAKSSRSGPQQASYYYDALLARIEAKLDGTDVVDGVPTRFEELDRLLGGGLPRENLIILAGRPGMGKTAIATAIEQNISAAGTPTLFFSLEMTGISLAQRNLSRHSRIKFANIKSAAIAEHEFGAMIESLEILSNAPCYIDETPGLTLSEIRARARAFVQMHPGAVIFVDYLQKVQPNPNGSTDPRFVVSEVSQGLLALARELKVPVVALAQLNRYLEQRTSKRPVMSDLKESGQLEQDAGIILFAYRDEVYNPDTNEPGVTEVIFGKNRDGECRTVKFASDLSRMLYREMASYESAGT
jgi:replicative DNA helicase